MRKKHYSFARRRDTGVFAILTAMKTKIEYDPMQYNEKVNRLIMLKAEQWKCPPSEALARLLDELAARELKTAA